MLVIKYGTDDGQIRAVLDASGNEIDAVRSRLQPDEQLLAQELEKDARLAELPPEEILYGFSVDVDKRELVERTDEEREPPELRAFLEEHREEIEKLLRERGEIE
jgi:hypothetical protein